VIGCKSVVYFGLGCVIVVESTASLESQTKDALMVGVAHGTHLRHHLGSLHVMHVEDLLFLCIALRCFLFIHHTTLSAFAGVARHASSIKPKRVAFLN
jgi:uncharacterized membrane protein YoaK (UPF0700 family)